MPKNQTKPNQHYSFVYTQLNGFKYWYVSDNWITHQSFVYIQSNNRTVLFVWTLSGAPIQSYSKFFVYNDKFSYPLSSHNGPSRNNNEDVLHIPQRSMTGALSSDCLESYSRQSLGEAYSSEEIHSVYSTVQGDWVAFEQTDVRSQEYHYRRYFITGDQCEKRGSSFFFFFFFLTKFEQTSLNAKQWLHAILAEVERKETWRKKKGRKVHLPLNMSYIQSCCASGHSSYKVNLLVETV